MGTFARNEASFRDPAGFVFVDEGVVYRQVNEAFAPNYRRLMDSGLYAELVEQGLLVEHEEVTLRPCETPRAHAVLRPRRVPFISYPYEWCFGQLKAAALLTLEVQTRAIAHGLVLRDASAYNVQFLDGRPIVIDTLSFGQRVDGEPWVAYRQFCQHFLAPLALMSRAHPSLGRLLQTHIDGVPLEVAARLLPPTTWLRVGLLTHIHLHSRSSVKAAGRANGRGAARASHAGMTKSAMLGMLGSLQATIEAMDYRPRPVGWTDYYANTNYSAAASADKQEAVRRLVNTVADNSSLTMAWDLGANTGRYSAIAAARASQVVSFDLDPGAVELHHRDCVARRERRILPLVQDLANPSPAIGWRARERRSLAERGPADLVLALALVHHLAIGNNIPLPEIAMWLAALGTCAIVEFVPKEDTQVQRMLAAREDIFHDYTQAAFEAACGQNFRICARLPVRDSCRTLYLMERHAPRT